MKKSARNKKESFFDKQQEIVAEVVIEEKKVAKSRMKFLSQRRYQVGLLVLIIIVVGALVAGYGFTQKNDTIDGGKLTQAQITSLVAEVGEKMVIPKGETPTIATVTDVSKLESQPFFRDAQNGDKVMIFGSTNMAILYRQSIHKIVTVAPVNAQNSPIAADNTAPVPLPSGATPSVSPTPITKPVKVTILNGTKVAGLAKKAETIIKNAKYEFSDLKIVSLGNTTGDYEVSSISNASEPGYVAETELLNIVAPLNTKAKAIDLPAGEKAPSGVDVVIILGKDFSDAK